MAQKDVKKAKKGEGKTWHSRYVRVGFLRGRGALYGVKLVLNVGMAKKLSKDLRDCVKLAQKHGREGIEIDAHFGRQSMEGFKLDVRIYQPEEKD
jgi:hypothetical protein